MIRFIVTVLFASLCISACVPKGAVRIDNVPMYGQPAVERPPELKVADEEFISQVEKDFGSREEASRLWWREAEKYMAEGNLDYAMRRYNQSWLLDPNNYQPYWGFARVSLELDKIDDVVKFIDRAKELVDDPFQEVALLADAGTTYTYKAIASSTNEQSRYFATANENFEASIALEPGYGDSWRRWAYSLYEQGQYVKAWEKVKRARQLGAKPFSQEFINDLAKKVSES